MYVCSTGMNIVCGLNTLCFCPMLFQIDESIISQELLNFDNLDIKAVIIIRNCLIFWLKNLYKKKYDLGKVRFLKIKPRTARLSLWIVRIVDICMLKFYLI